MNLDNLQTVVQWCSFCSRQPAVAIVATEDGTEEWDACDNCLSAIENR